MLKIARKYIIDESNERVAVQLDLATFEKIEEVIEDYALEQILIQETQEEELGLDAAKSYYKTLRKAE